MLILNNEDVAKVLDMPRCLTALDSVFQEMAVGDAMAMGRIDLYVPRHSRPVHGESRFCHWLSGAQRWCHLRDDQSHL
jgi:hypothetical protein